MIILSLALLVVVAMVGFVLPEFTAIYRTFNTPLPWLTQAVIALADAVEHSGWLLALLALLPMVTLHWLKRDPRRERWRQQMLLRLPVAGALLRGQC